MRNVFFFHTINSIGGVETFFYELVRKYSAEFDITVYYVNGDAKQISRLRKYVRVVRFDRKPIVCERAFFNYYKGAFIDYVKADKYYDIIHADFKAQGLVPHLDDRIDKYIAVSKSAADSFYELTGIRCTACPNPLTLEEIEHPPLILCSAQRMTGEKGGKRIKALVEHLDRTGLDYIYFVFTNSSDRIISPNVIWLPQRLDVRKYIKMCDLFVALSDSEGRCYLVAEKLGYGTGKLLITPCPSFFEQGCDDENSIVLDFDLSNIDDVVQRIQELQLNKKFTKTFRPIEVKDKWNKHLAKGKPEYGGGKEYLLKTTANFEKFRIVDIRLGCVPKAGVEYWEDDIGRVEYLLNFKRGALVEVVGERP